MERLQAGLVAEFPSVAVPDEALLDRVSGCHAGDGDCVLAVLGGRGWRDVELHRIGELRVGFWMLSSVGFHAHFPMLALGVCDTVMRDEADTLVDELIHRLTPPRPRLRADGHPIDIAFATQRFATDVALFTSAQRRLVRAFLCLQRDFYGRDWGREDGPEPALRDYWYAV